MKLKGKKLADAMAAAIKKREAEDLARAQREVENKVNRLLDQIKRYDLLLADHAKQTTELQEKKTAVLKRLDAARGGDDKALDEPTDNPIQSGVALHYNLLRDMQMERMYRRW